MDHQFWRYTSGNLTSFQGILQNDYSRKAMNELEMVLRELDIQPISIEQIHTLLKGFTGHGNQRGNVCNR